MFYKYKETEFPKFIWVRERPRVTQDPSYGGDLQGDSEATFRSRCHP